ncbi:hypothetical protein NP493_39g03012 [Ridgeia piscesae]|uniref:TPM domain-containing protein n=1 Tax=Ridgeia piscesae TaxID=27915 RepID=A0AAD9UJS1_RIDPI|nr:hypothetical protein NP493_39g03012 [Ridgeia piscesae]
MTFARCVKLIITCVVVSVCVHASTTTAVTDAWTYAYDEFPNPQLDVNDCGNNGSRSWVCDPGRLLTLEEGSLYTCVTNTAVCVRVGAGGELCPSCFVRGPYGAIGGHDRRGSWKTRQVDTGQTGQLEDTTGRHWTDGAVGGHDRARQVDTGQTRQLEDTTVDALDKTIEELRTNDPCQGWVAAVAVVPSIRLKNGSIPSNSDEQLDATRRLANYLRRTSWRFGMCNNDLVIVRSHTAGKLWTSTASGVREKLTDDCVDSIFQQARNDFKEQNYATAFTILLQQYQRVQTGEKACVEGEGGGGGIGSYITPIVLGVVFSGAFLGGCVYCCTKNGRQCGGGGSGRGGGHYSGGGDYGGGGGGDCGGGGGGDGGGGGGGGD